MNTTITELEGKYIVALEGELDTAHAMEVEQAMQPLYELNGKEITIDCTKLEYIASSGLRLFILLLRYASQHGCSVCVKGANPLLMSIFEATGFKALFRFVD